MPSASRARRWSFPLAPGRPGRVRRLPSGKLEIVVDADVPLAEWLETLPALIAAAKA